MIVILKWWCYFEMLGDILKWGNLSNVTVLCCCCLNSLRRLIPWTIISYDRALLTHAYEFMPITGPS